MSFFTGHSLPAGASRCSQARDERSSALLSVCYDENGTAVLLLLGVARALHYLAACSGTINSLKEIS